MRPLVYGVTLFTISLFTACSGNEVVEAPDGRGYLPLEVGREYEYRVDSIIFNDAGQGNALDTFSSFILERIVDYEVNGEDTTFIIERSFRRSAEQNWVLTDIWTSERDRTFAYRIAENLRLIKLRFPVRAESTWIPTTFIDEGTEVPVGSETIEMFTNWSARVVGLGTSENIGGMQYDNVLSVIQADDNIDIERRYVFEQYASGVGLVARRDTILDSVCKRLGNLAPCLEEVDGELVLRPWIEIGEKGYIMNQVLIRYE